MARRPDRGSRFFIVKHDLASFEAFPGRVWQTGRRSDDMPASYRQVRPGDSWVAYAYQKTEGDKTGANLVQGFFKSKRGPTYAKLPTSPALESLGYSGKNACVIEGEADGRQPRTPVLLPPLASFLGRRLFTRSSVFPITREEFWKIRDFVLGRDEPLGQDGTFGATPRNEQELLVAFTECAKRIGINRIVRVGTRFPDLTVELGSSAKTLHVELELVSGGFVSHRHGDQVKRGMFDGTQVCVVCWVDDDPTVKKRLPVFEVRDLLSGRKSLVEAL